MKVQHAESHVKGSHGLTEAKAFSIRAGAHAFKMLSSGLYSDKVGAVLREIGCNATDAHIEHGTPDRPIEVKLPNRIDNQFYIKDWGPGLSHEDVMNLYTTYFASTKQNSNDYTGAFGLGSKSPFSYTDSFSVTSVHGGRKRTYSAHLGDDGSPTIALLTTESPDDDWKHGIMIGFPVRPADYGVFQERAADIFRWFRVTPKVVGAPAVVPVKWGQDLELFGKVANGGAMRVLMGNVTYPVDRGSLQGLSEFAAYAFQFSGMVLKMPIGSVQVAASRESLQYDPVSVKALNERLEQVMRIIADDLAKKVEAFDRADWRGKCEMKKLHNTWKDDSIGYVNWVHLFKLANMANAKSIASTLATGWLPLPADAGKTGSFRILTLNYHGKVQHKVVNEGMVGHGNEAHQGQIDLEPETAVYYGDAPHPLARARKAVLEKKYAQIVLVTPNVKKDDTKAKFKAEALRFARDMGIKDVFDVGTLPLPDGFAAKGSGKSRKKKGPTLAPLPSMTVEVLDGATVKPTDITKIAPPDQHFICKAPGWNYNADRGARILDTTADKDRAYSRNAWIGAWSSYQKLREALGFSPANGFLLMEVATIRALELPKRGWKTSFAAIKSWLEDPAVRDAVMKKAMKWRPTISMPAYSTAGGWVSFFVWMQENDPAGFAVIASHLKAAGLLDELVELHTASKAAKDRAGANMPLALELYDRLRMFFGVAPIVVTAGRTYLAPADLDGQIHTRFPLMQAAFTPRDLEVVMKYGKPAQVEAFLKLLFS